ncbi:MAG: hypothetical protein DBY37_07180 [Desulfovibrionaceae bacterium]|nr:MAG: hypothetical protein DBY37_07180 [Desulfovibrionaceae bacterium]
MLAREDRGFSLLQLLSVFLKKFVPNVTFEMREIFLSIAGDIAFFLTLKLLVSIGREGIYMP